ncbi:MAG: leucine-rich repeat domain-containing protein [Ruminococcus sp.]|nr:leucine-rich repeat domain-containing protein [Ruminococcus sp.]
MKRIMSVILAGIMVVSTAAVLAGCGCDNKKSKSKSTNTPGYSVVPTDPDLKDSEFGFYRLNKEELMVSAYFGKSKDIKIPSSFQNYKVTVVGHSLFNKTEEGIESVEIPDSITEVQDYAFAANSNLSKVKLSKNLKIIGNNAFWNCPKLTSIELPSSLKKIGVYAFSATGLTSVTLPESKTLTQLDQFVFFQSKNLKEVTIPASMTNIADNAFNECADGLTIKAKANSYAISYAKKHNYKTEEIK